MATDFNFKPQAFYRIIEVREKLGKPIIERMVWSNMRFDTVVKWEWYFKYRAALLQIKYPRYKVDLIMGSKDPVGLTKAQLDLKVKNNRIKTCRRMITKFKNAIQSYEEEQKTLIIPYFDNPKYLKLKDKLETYQSELNQLLTSQ